MWPRVRVMGFPNPFQKYMECRKYPEIAEKIVAEEVPLEEELKWEAKKDENVIAYYEAYLENARRYKPDKVETYETYIWALKLSMRFIKGRMFIGYFSVKGRPFELWLDGKTLKDVKLNIVDVVRFAKTQWDACVKHSNICTCDCNKPEAYCRVGVYYVAPADIDTAAKALLASATITSELGVSVGEVLQKLRGKD
jgi:hypothetical protein